MTVSNDRWTCPSCGRTLVVYGSEPDVKASIAACQERHSKAHKEARYVLARLGFPEPYRPAKRYGAA